MKRPNAPLLFSSSSPFPFSEQIDLENHNQLKKKIPIISNSDSGQKDFDFDTQRSDARNLRIVMAIAPEETTNICSHCDRAIPSTNIDLHFAHCSRNLEKCKVCGDMVPKKYAEEHYSNTHAPVACSLCSETMDREILAIHKGENCPQRIVTCEFCEFPLPAIDLIEHQEVCGNRTELCHLCNRYIRLRERYNHEIRCNGIPDTTVGPSRDVREGERGGQGGERRAGQEYSRGRILFTIAITGIAVLLGSLFFQKKVNVDQVN